MQTCPQCPSDRVMRNGAAAGKPKKQCNQCRDQCTRTTPRGQPLATQSNAVLWYVSGMAMHRIAFLLQVSAQAVLPWRRDVATPYDERPEASGRTIVLELDERWHYRKKKQGKLWIWKALERDPGQLLDWAGGRREKASLKKMGDRLATWDVHMYGPDKWATSASSIPQAKLGQSQTTTHDIERKHCRQRPWCGRFKRKSIIVSKSTEMVDLTMALCAQFGVNGNQDEFLSLLT